MVAKSVIDVEVDDKEFAAFQRLFDKYQAQLAKMPGAWGAVGKEVKGIRSSFEGVAAALMAQADLSRKAAQEQRRNRSDAEGTATAWDRIADRAKSFSSDIRSATLSMLKWTTLSSAAAGLLGVGSLFGLERLSSGVAASRQRAGGLDVGYGQQKAFGISYGRFTDNPDAMLHTVSGALHDITSPAYVSLLAAGMTQSFLASHNAAEVSAEVIRRVPQLFGGIDKRLIGNKLTSLGLDQVLSQGDVNKILAASPDERAAQASQFASGSRRFDLPPDVQRAWQDFETRMSAAGTGVETVLVKGLSGLAGPLTKLSGAFERAAETFLSSTSLKQWIDQLGTGLESFARTVDTPEFRRGIESFVDNLGRIGSVVKKVADLLTPRETITPAQAGSGFGGVSGNSLLGRWLGVGGTTGGARLPGGDTFGHGAGSALGGLDPDFDRRLRALLASVPRELGSASVTSGYRDAEAQRRLYDNRASNPYPVAPPGRSEHERGTAADTGGNARVLSYLHAHARDYGLEYPFSNDPVHVHLAPGVAPGGSQPKVRVEVYDNTGGNVNIITRQTATGG